MVISRFCAIACPHVMKPNVIAASAAHLTFLPLAPPAIRRNVKCKAALASIFASVPLVPTFVRERAAKGYERRNRDTSAAHLTFLPPAPPAIRRNVKCKAALDSIFASVPLVPTFVRERAAKGYDRRNRDTRPNRLIIGPLLSRPWPP